MSLLKGRRRRRRRRPRTRNEIERGGRRWCLVRRDTQSVMNR